MALTLIRVLIVSDSPVIRNNITHSLQWFSRVHVIGEASSGEEVLELVTSGTETEEPDVVLLDLSLPGMGGIAIIRALRRELLSGEVVALASAQEGSQAEEALQAGAIGSLPRNNLGPDTLFRAVLFAYNGMSFRVPVAPEPMVVATPIHTLVPVVRRSVPTGQDLTEREREVLGLLVKGLLNRQIAEQLVVTTATVKFHLRSIRSKLGTSNRTETVVVALQYHLVPLP